jgi:hypothetical protein
VSRQSEAFSALDRIESGDWDRYLLRLQAAINMRTRTDDYRAHIIARADAEEGK